MPPVVAVVATVFFEAVFVKVVIAAIVVGLSYYQQARARRKARDAYNKSLQDRLVMTATVDQARTRCYGRVRNVDGVLFKATWGDKKQYYSLVIALCGHEIDGVEQVMFGDTVLTLDSQGQVQDAPWRSDEANTKTVQVPAGPTSVTLPDLPIGGSVLAVRAGGLELPISVTVVGPVVTFPAGSEAYPRRIVYQVATGRSHAVVTVYKGGPGQDLSAALATRFPDLITPGEHRFSGIACMLVEMSFSQDAFPNGVPNPISAIFRGAKILDPRTGVTAWSENPALIARDWSLYANGGGCQASDLVGEDFIAAANACDVSHAFTSVNGDGDSVTTTRPMYTCGIVCDTSANPLETLAGICESMAGDFAWPGGRLSVRAGAYSLPALTITGDWLSDKGAIEMVKDAPRAELINVMTPTIANAANRYIAAPLPRVVAAPYIAIDGEEYVQEVTFEGVTDSDHAAHVASVMIKDARAAKTYTLPCNLRGLQAKIGQNATINIPEIGLSNEVMRLVGWKLDFEQLCCFLTYKATSAAIFDPDATFQRDDALPNTSLPNPFAVPAVTGIAIESGTNQLFVQSDGTILTRMRVSWNAPADEAVINSGAVEIRYGTLDKTPDQWQVVSVPGSETQVYITGLEDERVYGLIVRFRNRLVAGKWSLTQMHQVIGKSAAPVAPAGLSATRTLGALRISRTPSTEADWAYTVFQYSSDGGTNWNAIPGTSDKNGVTWPGPVVGALKIRARDVDTSGNVGAWSASLDATVAADVVGDGSNSGDALNADPYVLDSSKWEGLGDVQRRDDANSPGSKGKSYFVWSGPGVRGVFAKELIPVDPTARVYNFSGNLLASPANNRPMYLVIRPFRADGREYITGDLGGLSWGGYWGGYTYGGVPTSDGSFRIYGGDFGAGTSRPLPSDVAYIRIGILLQEGGSGSSNTTQAAQYLRLTDVTAARAASAAAAAAQVSADSALLTLSAIQSDSVLSRSEKPAVILEYKRLTDEDDGIVARATAYGIGAELSDYNAALTALAVYLAGLSPPWDDVGQDTPIAPTTFEAKWRDAYSTRQALLNRISAIAKNLADAAQGTANSAATAASNAQTSANSALGTLNAMRSNGILDAGEKPALVREWQAINGENAGIVARAAAYGLTYSTSSDYQAYTDGYNNLAAYLSSLSPSFADTTTDTTIVPATFQSKFLDFYNGRQALLNKIAQIAGTVSAGYRQATDPSAGGVTILDGTEWLDTSTGKSYKWYSGAWRPNVGAGSVGTGELGSQAATSVTQDTYNLAGTTTPSGSTAYTLREVVVTPTENCVIEFTARMDGSSFFDQGAYMWWALSINGGAESTLADFVPVGVTGTYYSGTGTVAVSFSAAAGVPLYFRVKSSRITGGPSPSPGLSQMRVTQVKR